MIIGCWKQKILTIYCGDYRQYKTTKVGREAKGSILLKDS